MSNSPETPPIADHGEMLAWVCEIDGETIMISMSGTGFSAIFHGTFCGPTGTRSKAPRTRASDEQEATTRAGS